MSAENIVKAEAADTIYCASCGKAEIDDIKLKYCDKKCDLAQYCSDDCQQEHRQKHEEACKKRVVELREELLFRQPESSHCGDCPICFLPMPLDVNQSTVYSCCSKTICDGCDFANDIREEAEGLKSKCPFCRKEVPETKEERDNDELKRAEAGDPVAMRGRGVDYGGEGDYEIALQFLTRAAELGDAMAHYNLSVMYRNGQGVEEDEEKERYHGEEAAIAGHPKARFNLGTDEEERGRFDRAVKHFIIAANLGHDNSMQELKECYKNGHVSKDDLAAAFRAHQAAVDATKSPQREEAIERALS